MPGFEWLSNHQNTSLNLDCLRPEESRLRRAAIINCHGCAGLQKNYTRKLRDGQKDNVNIGSIYSQTDLRRMTWSDGGSIQEKMGLPNDEVDLSQLIIGSYDHMIP
jgi:hypothetical protein